MIIEPKIYFAGTKRAIQAFARQYNEGKESREQLKSAHLQQMYAYVRLLERNISQRNVELINSGQWAATAIDRELPPHLLTNNKEMSKQLDGGHPSTILRRYERLAQAGLIRKINHGPVRNYEIIINPGILHIIDLSGGAGALKPDPAKAEKWAEQWDLENSKIAKRTPYTVSFIEHSNKLIIPQKVSDKSDEILKSTSKDTSSMETPERYSANRNEKQIEQEKSCAKKENPPKNFGSSVIAAIKTKIEHAQNEAAADYAEKMQKLKQTLEKLRHQYATMTVAMMIDYLLPGINVFSGERKRAISYVEKHYFEHCQTIASIERAFAEYSEKLEAARKFKETHPGYTPFPHFYFQIDNPNGFNSPKWIRQRNKFEKLKRWQNSQAKLMAAIRRLNDNPTREQLDKEIEYVKHNIPDLLKAFFSQIYTNFPETAIKTNLKKAS